jgi:plastocyanin
VHSFKRGVVMAMIAGTAGGVALVPVAVAGKTPPTKVVHIGDDFYAPGKVTVKKGGQVRWQWNDTTFGSHNVTLISGPKSVKKSKFTSITASGGFKWTRKFVTAGTYKFRCTVHPEMHMSVVVKP